MADPNDIVINENLKKALVNEVETRIAERLYSTGTKLSFSEEEQSKITQKIQSEVELLVEKKIREIEIHTNKLIKEIENIAQKEAKLVELESWDKVNERIDKRLSKTWKHIIIISTIVISAFTLGGFLSMQHIKDLTTNKVSELIIQQPDLKEDIVKSVSDILASPSQKIIEMLKATQETKLKEINQNVQKSDSLVNKIGKQYDRLVQKTLKEFEDLLDILSRVEQAYEINKFEGNK